jgi:Spy/CpxP family protein refolding chaperone
MKTIRPAAIALTLALLAGGTAIAQRGRGGPALGQAWGFRGVGLGNWALHENGVDSIAARFQLTEQQRAEFEALAQGFRSENGEVLSRWEQMRDEIQSLYTDDQQPTRDAIVRIGEKYNHPSEEMSEALDQLQVESAALLTPQQRRSFRGAAYGARGGRWDARGGSRMTDRRYLGPRNRVAPHSGRGMRLHQRSPRRRPPE